METRAARRERRRGWRWFAAWTLPGFAFGMQVSVIGPFFLPLLALGVLLSFWTRAREALGFLAGVGLLVLFIGLLHFGDDGGCSRPDPNTQVCGDGFAWRPWIAVGVVLVALAVTAYRFAHRDT